MTFSDEAVDTQSHGLSHITPQEQIFHWCDLLISATSSTSSTNTVDTSGKDSQFFLSQIKKILGVSLKTDDEGVQSEQASNSLAAVFDAEESLAAVFDAGETNDRGLRPLDILCRCSAANTTDEVCFAAMYLIQAGTDAAQQPSPSEAAPLQTCAYERNWKMLCTLLDLGVDASGVCSGSKQQLMGSTAIHALATGFRGSRAEDYAECFSALPGAGCDVDARDRKRQTALDIAVRTAATTGNSALIDAMFDYGVNIDGNSPTGALAVAQALSKRTNDARIMSQLSGSAFGAVARSVEALQALELVKNGHDIFSRP